MSEEVQERFEDYLELEQFIKQLHAQRSARPPANLTPQQMHIYGMAMLLHNASPRRADPRPEFKERLRPRLLEQAQAVKASPTAPPKPHTRTAGFQANPLSSTQSESTYAEKTRGVSRRTLFTGGTIAAASLLTGAGIEHSMEQPKSTSDPPEQRPLTENVPATWLRVASVGQLGKEPIRFTSDTIIGYVTRQRENSNGAITEQIVAFSAACTHRGCIVQWQGNKRRFLCPCHESAFDPTGNPTSTGKRPPDLTQLPRLETRIDNGNIYVKVPLPPGESSG